MNGPGFPADEVVYAIQQHLFVWPRPKPPILLFGSKIGTLAVTNYRVLFLSSGESGMAGQFTALGEAISGAPITALNLNALLNPGSLDVPLANVISLETRRRWDFASYLTLRMRTHTGHEQAFAFMSKFGFNATELRRVSDAVASFKSA